MFTDDGGPGKSKIIKTISNTNYKFRKAIRYKINTKSSSLQNTQTKIRIRHHWQNNNKKIKYLGINIKHVQDLHENQPADSGMNLFLKKNYFWIASILLRVFASKFMSDISL